MKTFRNFLTEGPLPLDQVSTEPGSKPAIVIQGRFQPPTAGHLKMIKQAHAKHKGTVAIVLVKSGKSDVKFDSTIQKKIFKKMLTGIPHVFVETSSGFIGDFVDALRRKGFEPKALYAGTDRKKGYEGQINSYKDRFNLDMTVEEIKRSDEDISATKVRDSLTNDDFEAFKKNMDKSVWPMFDALKKVI